MMTSTSTMSKYVPFRVASSNGVRLRVAQNLTRVHPLRSRRDPSFIVFAEPDVEGAIKEAQETCDSGNEAECATAWDTVEELSAAKARKDAQEGQKDPLEEYCEEVPEADECRVYED